MTGGTVPATPGTPPGGRQPHGVPLRVSTLELFFDLVAMLAAEGYAPPRGGLGPSRLGRRRAGGWNT